MAERVRRYAQWRSLPNPEAFIHALEANHAWEFARRPLDVNGLIEYWKQHGRLGSLTELIEHSLRLSLRETEPRETNYPLTPETARRGAEALAATVLLCRNFNIKVPDDAYVPSVSALDASNCLPAMWSAAEKRALLTRPLFDVSAVIRNRHVSKNVREDMFLLVRYGHLTACLEIALEVIGAPDEEETIKLYAAAALRKGEIGR